MVTNPWFIVKQGREIIVTVNKIKADSSHCLHLEGPSQIIAYSSLSLLVHVCLVHMCTGTYVWIHIVDVHVEPDIDIKCFSLVPLITEAGPLIGHRVYGLG